MTATKISAAVAVRPHLLQFLQTKVQTHGRSDIVQAHGRASLTTGEPLHLPGDNLASLYLTSLLTPATIFTVPPMDFDPPAAATARLNYVVSEEMERQGQFFLSGVAVKRFDTFLRRWMEETLFERVDNLTALGVQEKRVIEGFIEEFNMEVEFDTLKKACTRRRERLDMMPLKTRYNGRPNRPGADRLCEPCKYYG